MSTAIPLNTTQRLADDGQLVVEQHLVVQAALTTTHFAVSSVLQGTPLTLQKPNYRGYWASASS